MTENIQEEIEDKVIDYINNGVAGRLIIFKPEKKGLEHYLTVQRRGKYKEKEISIQVNALVLPAKDVDFVKDFSEEEFKADKNFYLLFAYFDEIKQGINDYIWLVPSLQFQEIAQVIKSEDGKNFFRFESSANLKNKNKYSKFILDIKDLGDLILDGLKRGGQINIKGLNFEEKKAISPEKLSEFLSLARQNTYATNSAGIDNPRLLESRQLEFQKADYFYRDIFFVGGKKIIGQEIIYQDSKPIWGMNYMGAKIGKVEEEFLKESLSKLAGKCRLGQSCQYEKRDYNYQDRGQGNVNDFSGEEQIFVGNKSIYKLNYQGGLI